MLRCIVESHACVSQDVLLLEVVWNFTVDMPLAPGTNQECIDFLDCLLCRRNTIRFFTPGIVFSWRALNNEQLKKVLRDIAACASIATLCHFAFCLGVQLTTAVRVLYDACVINNPMQV